MSEETKTMRMVPQCKGGKNVCFQMQGVIKLDDYEEFMTVMRKAVAENGSFNLLFHYTDKFQGWSQEAADANMKAIIEYGRFTTRLAYVNPPEKKIMQHKIAPELFGGEMKYFENDQLDEALEWVQAG